MMACSNAEPIKKFSLKKNKENVTINIRYQSIA